MQPNDRKTKPGHRTANQPSMRGVWLFGLTALVATATIAAIRLNPGSDELPSTIDQTAKSANAGANSNAAPDMDIGLGPWNEIRVRSGDTLGTILDERGLYSTQVKKVIHTDSDARALINLKPGEVLRYRLGLNNNLHDLVYNKTPTETIHLLRDDDGNYSVDAQTRDIQTRFSYVTGTIDSSLFLAGQEAGLSDPLIMRLTEIFGWDIDFAINLRKGDTFSVIHEEKYWLGQKIADGPIVAAEFVNQGKTYRAIGIRNAQGRLEYYTPNYRSVRRPFLRTPVQFSRISSGYGKRKHPILGRWRRHTGIDYAAPRGTPIRATAAGRIVLRGRKGGYGNAIIIKHGHGFSTLYGHMQRFRSGIRVGSYIEQGQIIGYVGMTGLATGPHLHYELRVNGRHHNPLTYPLPKAVAMDTGERSQFAELLTNWSPRLDLMHRGNVQLARNR
jgi:murein DD-endopeptidase MepM/ murein hydrolase activator NlpD